MSLTDEEFFTLFSLLRRYIDEEMDQWELWRAQSTYGETFITISFYPEQGVSPDAYPPLPATLSLEDSDALRSTASQYCAEREADLQREDHEQDIQARVQVLAAIREAIEHSPRFRLAIQSYPREALCKLAMKAEVDLPDESGPAAKDERDRFCNFVRAAGGRDPAPWPPKSDATPDDRQGD